MSAPRLRAPGEHGQILVAPAFDLIGAVLARNTHQSKSDTSYSELKAAARQAAISIAVQYHRDAGEPIPDFSTNHTPFWFVAGHQPELFHPGVWFKNFVLHQLARTHHGIALNLIIDSDTTKPPVLHVPHGDKISRVPFDRSATDAPFEECTVQDERMFADLPQQLAPIMASWGFEPMLADFWREVLKQVPRTQLIGERFVAARRVFERRFGITPFEVPMSRLCQSAPFATFVHLICRDLGRFHALYNEAVQSYRREHDIRSRSHPVPELAADGDWLETPFWAWRRGQSRRHRLFLRKSSLRFGDEIVPNGPDDPSAILAHFEQGLKIRPRALTTTMFARLFLADLFIHGIGGGIYDELTDRIIERFWNIDAPGYLIASATLLLPLSRFRDAANEVHALGRRLRDLQYQPERFVTSPIELLRAKREWIARDGATHAERVHRFEEIRAINAQLQSQLAGEFESTRAALGQRRHEVECDDVAARRDYAFCLCPEALLREFYTKERTFSLI